ncbi:hypothetical protein LUX02_05305 [Streptomyces somaliensis]|nr:hypothetical protein [Streptomyces somaliensis]
MARVQPSRMSTGRLSSSGCRLHRPTVPRTEWCGYAPASISSYTGTIAGFSSTSATTSAPEAATARAVPSGSGLSAFTLCETTVRSPPGPFLSVTRPPKRFSHTAAGTRAATRAVGERRSSARPARSGTSRPNQGRNVSMRLPRLPMSLGTWRCRTITSASRTAHAQSTVPRRRAPGPRHRANTARTRDPARRSPAAPLPVPVMSSTRAIPPSSRPAVLPVPEPRP